jgi:pyridoxal phosphate enzyme (YggS family)
LIALETVADRLAGVRERIERAGGDPTTVRVVAVTKGFGPDAVTAAVGAGLTDVGENYADELLDKVDHRARAASPGPEPAWHFLGAVQRRKVPRLAPVVDCWQSVTRAVEGRAIADRRPGASVLVEIDTTGLPTRSGVASEEVERLVEDLAGEGLRVLGLMTVAPTDPQGARSAFRTLRQLADGLGLPERSMGMSDDLELAVAEGSTMVRVGRALFGSRSAAKAPKLSDAGTGQQVADEDRLRDPGSEDAVRFQPGEMRWPLRS